MLTAHVNNLLIIMTILGPQNLTQVRCDTHICLKTTFEGKRVTCRNLFNKRNSHILTDPTLNNWRFYCIIYLYLTLYSLFSLFRDGFIETWERELKFSIIIHECPKIGIYAEIPSKYKNLKKKHQSNSNNTTKSINHCCTEPIYLEKKFSIFFHWTLPLALFSSQMTCVRVLQELIQMGMFKI